MGLIDFIQQAWWEAVDHRNKFGDWIEGIASKYDIEIDLVQVSPLSLAKIDVQQTGDMPLLTETKSYLEHRLREPTIEEMSEWTYSRYFEPIRRYITALRGKFTWGDLEDFGATVNAFKPIFDERVFEQQLAKMAELHQLFDERDMPLNIAAFARSKVVDEFVLQFGKPKEFFDGMSLQELRDFYDTHPHRKDVTPD
jgi:hypothetical protein